MSPEIIIVIALAALQVATLALLWRQGRQLRRALAQRENETGGVPALMLVNALNQIDHRMGMLEERARQPEPPRRVAVPATVAAPVGHYELAQQLAREGGSLEQLVARCGISRNEAELILRLYAKRELETR